MKWAALVAGFVLLSAIPCSVSTGCKRCYRSLNDFKDPVRSKRSIDLNDVYYSKMRQYRLPSEVTPTSYHLHLNIPPSLEKESDRSYLDRVKINFTWSDMSDQIILNVHPSYGISTVNIRMLQLPPDEAEKGASTDVYIANWSVQSQKNWLVVNLEQMLKNGSVCELDITYNGNITTNETTGLYRSAFMDSDGRKHSFVATYLQLDNARKMFPCMDEPPYKATFKVTLTYLKELTARTNMPSISRRQHDKLANMVVEEFEETPRMSTNQLALMLSDLECIEPTAEINEMDGKRLQVKVWARKEFIESLASVPNKIVRIVNYLQNYFNSSIGIPKLDVVALPIYTASKASDNWGLMFFKESELSSPLFWSTTYELLYQWIGQSVTPYRRNDAPVNKALNSFLASMATFDLNPDEMEGKWPMTMLYPLYYEFAQTAPFSRVAGIRHEATWTKAELVFRMFNYTLGRGQFQKGAMNFFHQQSKENRRTFFADDIFTYLNEVADDLPPGLTINSIAASWINRDRVPLVTVIRDYKTEKINLSQKVYLRDIPPQSTVKVSYQWDIPIVMQAQDNLNFSNTKPTVWLTKKIEPKNLTIPDITTKDNFIIVNPEEIGMFPVNYDSCNWKTLSKYLRGPDREKIPPITRAKLLHDAWNLAYAGELCFSVAMNMTLFLKEEKSHVVWEPVFTMIRHVGRRIEGLDVYLKFEAYIRSLLKPLYLELSENPQPNEPSWKTHMRGLMKNFLCRAGYEPCIKEARDHFKKWLTDEEPDKGNPVANEFLCPVFKWGTDEEWEFGLQRVINFPKTSLARKQNERTYLLKTLAGCPKDANKIERLLQVTVLDQNENFTDADIHLIFSMLTGSSTGYKTLFNFLHEHWYTVKERFENKTYLWDGIVNFATSSFNTQEGYDKVMQFYKDHQYEFESADAIIKKALAIIKQETKWNEENVPVIDTWLNENLSKEDLDAIAASMSTESSLTITASSTTTD